MSGDSGNFLPLFCDLDPKVREKMIRKKLREDFVRPSQLDVLAQTAVITAQRSSCLFYNVGVVIFLKEGGHILSTGYNGPVKGDVDPREVGCARIDPETGKLREGGGFCRGSHAEINAISFLTVSPVMVKGLCMMVTLHPCFNCAKQIVNSGIKEVHYIWEYGRDLGTTEYLKRLGVEVIHYTSPLLEKWIELNCYDPESLRGS